MLFVRFHGGPNGLLSVPGEIAFAPGVLRSVTAAAAGVAVARMRPAELSKLAPAWLPETLAAAFEGTVAVAVHRNSPDAPPEFTWIVLVSDAEVLRDAEAAVLERKGPTGIVKRDLRGHGTLYTERVANGDAVRPGWSWTVLEDRVIAGRNPQLVARAALAVLQDRPNLSRDPAFRAAWDSRPADAVGFAWMRSLPVLPRTARNAALAAARFAGRSTEAVTRSCAGWIADALDRCDALPIWVSDAGTDGPGWAVLRRMPEGFVLESGLPLPPGLAVTSLLPRPLVRELSKE
jgi:hypothetical protein